MFDLPWILIGRILLAAFLGAMIGLERQWRGHEAGIRTNLIISLSSCLFTIISIEGFHALTANYNPEQIAGQIVTGVGFLGAGAILHDKTHTIGFTTAASIWLVAAIGMAVGAGMILLALLVTLIAICALFVLSPISIALEKSARRHRSQEPEMESD